MLSFYLSLIDTQEGKIKFEEMYNKYKNLMLYIAFDILKDNYLAEDAVHMAFMKIVSNFKEYNFEDDNKTKSFVAILAKNTAISMYRKRKKTIEINIENLSREKYDFDSISEEMKVDFIKEEIKNMNDVYKDVLMLKYFNDFDNKEISKILEISESTVRKRLERARKILEEKLK